MLGDLLSGGLKFIGGMLDRDAQKDVNAQNQANRDADRAMQEWAMTHGIRTRVADANAAGIHPLFALGASTSSYTPMSVGGNSPASMGSALSDMGQDVSRAVAAGGGAEQRATQGALSKVTIEGLQLDNDIKRAKLASDLKNLSPPAVGAPGTGSVPEANKFEDRPRLMTPGGRHSTNPNTTNAEDYEKRYGEMSDFVHGPQIYLRDELDNAGGYELTLWARKLLQKIGILN